MPIIKLDPFGELEELLGEKNSRLGWDFAVDVYYDNVVLKIVMPKSTPKELTKIKVKVI